MKVLDPTYLRYVYDGVQTGIISYENSSVLPDGLVGVYEEAFNGSISTKERNKLLEFFSVWALLKKEVSVSFILPLLSDWTEEQLFENISAYSKWFNSPVSGKFQLYHERFRAFIMERMTAEKIKFYNNRIIRHCRESLSEKQNSEWEFYALEYLSTHLLLPAMEGVDSVSLKDLANNQAYWNRQIEVSKGYDCTKKMLNEMMLWASKYDDDQVIECALNKVELYQMEQNDAPRILELVVQNEIETALQRIESFGGNDKEGLQRKFILYMLCLMELTLTDIKDKPHNIDSIKQILIHLDNHLPVDRSVLDWHLFFSCYRMFQVFCVLAEIGLDYMLIYKRSSNWKSNWIRIQGPYTNDQFEILIKCTEGIADVDERCQALVSISIEQRKQNNLKAAESILMEALFICADSRNNNIKILNLCEISKILAAQGKIEEALSCILEIKEQPQKCEALVAISSELAKQKKPKQAKSLLIESLADAENIKDEYYRTRALIPISSEMVKQGMVEDAISCTMNINSQRDRSEVQSAVALTLANQGKLQKALSYAKSIPDEYWKSKVLVAISSEFARQGNLDKAEMVLSKSLSYAWIVTREGDKSHALIAISSELVNQGKHNEAAIVINEILSWICGSDWAWKCDNLVSFSSILSQQGKLNEADYALRHALLFAIQYGDDSQKDRILSMISLEFAKQGKVKESIDCLNGIISKQYKSEAQTAISFELSKKAKLESLLVYDVGICNAMNRSVILADLSLEIAKQGNINESLYYANSISVGSKRRKAILGISLELVKQDKVEEALSCARTINIELERIQALAFISSELHFKGILEKASVAILEALSYAESIYVGEKSSALFAISLEFAKQGKLEEALFHAKGIKTNWQRSQALAFISSELNKSGIRDEANSLMQEAISCFEGKSLRYAEKELLIFISELVNQGKIEDAFSYIRGLEDESMKCNCMVTLNLESAKQGKHDEVYSAISYVDGISEEYWRIQAMIAISAELARQGKLGKAISYSDNISFVGSKSNAMRKISLELSKQENWKMAEEVGLIIKKIDARYQCWKEIASSNIKKNEYYNSFMNFRQFKFDEAKLFYLKGWSENINITFLNKDCIQKVLPILVNDTESIREILQKFAIAQVAFSKSPPHFVQRLNRSLNIQWVMDIASQFLKDKNRTSSY